MQNNWSKEKVGPNTTERRWDQNSRAKRRVLIQKTKGGHLYNIGKVGTTISELVHSKTTQKGQQK